MLMIPRQLPLILGALLLCVSAGGCASAKARKRASKKSPDPTNEQKPAPPSGAWRQSIGKVILVNEGMGFVLVDIGTAPSPVAGTPLQSYLQSEPTSQLSVSVYQRRPYLIADVVGGMPRVGDSVTLMPARQSAAIGGQPSGAKASSSKDPLVSMPDRETEFRPQREISGGVIAPVRIFDRDRPVPGSVKEVYSGDAPRVDTQAPNSDEKTGGSAATGADAGKDSAVKDSDMTPSGSAIPGLPLRRGRTAER